MGKQKVNARYEKFSDPEGWHIKIISPEGDIIDDSRKVGFPIDVESFGEDDPEDIYDALREEYPDAIININGVA
ncbi:MAG: hypothetical protein NT163_02880 [Chlorobiales bacterium]|jgi:hypothetical protein|nr:hypothetical protein [Chlorobiales bacterium]